MSALEKTGWDGSLEPSEQSEGIFSTWAAATFHVGQVTWDERGPNVILGRPSHIGNRYWYIGQP